jgi:hypothetical protein
MVTCNRFRPRLNSPSLGTTWTGSSNELGEVRRRDGTAIKQ